MINPTSVSGKILNQISIMLERCILKLVSVTEKKRKYPSISINVGFPLLDSFW